MPLTSAIGSVVTFYSWKGGVGRTMALANIAIQLARRGHRVLIVDWDLEAPGLDHYFLKGEAASRIRVRKPNDDTGLIGLLKEAKLSRAPIPQPREWHRRLHYMHIPPAVASTNNPRPSVSPRLHMLASGLGSENYGQHVANFSWPDFFAESRGGEWLEALRDQWRKTYDFVLIDSRTGLTDAGGVCTVQMPDFLVLVFTSSGQSLTDGLKLISSAQTQRRNFAYDRAPLAVVPLLTRWDGDDEVDLGVKWLDRMNDELRTITNSWLPKEFEPRQFLEKVRVPHVARFSFGEPLPVITHSLTDTSLPGQSYEYIARLLDTRLLASGEIIDPTYCSPPTHTPPIRFFSEAGLNAKNNFDSYVIGPNSSYSVAVAKAVAEKPGRIYNPLFFYGPRGFGKTHLLQAIGQEVLARRPHANARYVTAEQFINEFVESDKNQNLNRFRKKYRAIDVLLVDDVQTFEMNEKAQEEFFHTFNELFNNAKQIVLASDRPPREIKNLHSRLLSRFEWGLASQIQAPDFETRIAILRRKQSDFNVSLEPWIIDFMAQRIRTNIRKLEGALMRVAAYISLEGAIVTESTLIAMLHDVIDEDPSKTVTVDRIQRIVATHYNLRVSDLIGLSRTKNIHEARQVAMYLTRTLTKLSLVKIGDEFGGRANGTVIDACKNVINLIHYSSDFRRTIEMLVSNIREE